MVFFIILFFIHYPFALILGLVMAYVWFFYLFIYILCFVYFFLLIIKIIIIVIILLFIIFKNSFNIYFLQGFAAFVIDREWDVSDEG